MIRSDAARKVAGGVEFGTDLERPRMLWGAFVPAPLAHGRIRSIDLDAALRQPGVVAAIAAREVRALLPGGKDTERPVFPPQEITYRHQPVAAVAARTLAEARAAAARVRVDVEPMPVHADLDSVFPDWPAPAAAEGTLVNAHVRARHGDPERAFAEAEHLRRDEFRTSGVAQVPLEPHACVAEVRDGRWHVVSSTQTPFGVRDDASEILGLPVESIVVEASWVGGGFGGKGAALLEPYALVLAAAADMPVKLALGYRE